MSPNELEAKIVILRLLALMPQLDPLLKPMLNYIADDLQRAYGDMPEIAVTFQVTGIADTVRGFTIDVNKHEDLGTLIYRMGDGDIAPASIALIQWLQRIGAIAKPILGAHNLLLKPAGE